MSTLLGALEDLAKVMLAGRYSGQLQPRACPTAVEDAGWKLLVKCLDESSKSCLFVPCR